MLTELRIRGLGVIDEVVLEPGAGFTAVTGETGAGKTMVVTGLSLLLGARAEPRLIRGGATRALVESRWRTDAAGLTAAASVGGLAEEGELLVSRQLTPGRSRTFVGGAAVPTSTCAALVAEWATIHGQSEQVQLATAERQRDILDRFAGAGLAAELDVYRDRYAARRLLAAELATLTGESQARARELDLLTFGLAEISAVGPEPGEDLSLAEEARRLQAGDDIRIALDAALGRLSGDDDPSSASALALLASARKPLASAAELDPALAPLNDNLTEATVLVGELAAALAGRLSSLDDDPGRVDWVAGRRAALQRLQRKYGSTVNEVIAWAEEAQNRATELSGDDERIDQLSAEVAALTEALEQSAQRISAARVEAAGRLAHLVAAELAALALPAARLEFQVLPAALGPHGADQVNLIFAAHPAAQPGPLGKVASGGELSRVRLALEVVLAGSATGMTLVFDEVDAGVGGAVALEIGRRLARLARHQQVIVVTHLAQVAAFADKQVVLTKADRGGISTTGLVEVSGTERQAELARMMGGLESTESALAHAAELLAEAHRG